VLKWPKTKPRVEVLWVDATSRHGWSESPTSTSVQITSIGYLESEDDRQVVVVEAFDHDPESTRKYGCSTAIPRSAVRDMRFLTEKRNPITK